MVLKKSKTNELFPDEKKVNLEEALREKVSPLLEETMEKNIGITIPQLGSDITDKLKNPPLSIYIPQNLSFNSAKKMFKKEFIKRELRFHRGNVSQLAKLLGLDRRSIHRAIKGLAIDVKEVREQPEDEESYQSSQIDKTIRATLDQYKEIIHPQKMEKMYQELPHLTRNIARFLPLPELTWKEAEKEFEKQFLEQALENAEFKVGAAAAKLRLRAETLHRKIKKLGIRKS